MSGPARPKTGSDNPTLADRLNRARRRAWHTGKTRRARRVQSDAEAAELRYRRMGID